MLRCEYWDLGRLDYGEAFELQKELVRKRQQGIICDQLLLVEHPHVITLGRSGKKQHLLAGEEVLRERGVSFYPTDRGGDITYHGPGQVVGYPILDLQEWKKDVVAYVRAIEQVLIEALREFGIAATRISGLTGVWVGEKKIAAIGIHISRWVTYHGFALNHTTDLSYFGLIVPCGLTKPVTSMAELGCTAGREEVIGAVVRNFGKVFDREMVPNSARREKAS